MKTLSDYGLNENPFSSQASDSGKYPFVPSTAFNELISDIEGVLDNRDAVGIIVRGPQGSGKTATKRGLQDYFAQKNNVRRIEVTLSSIEIKDLTASIIDNAKDQNFIDTDFINEIGTLPDEKPRLEKIIIQVLEKVVGNEYSGILIIDEFDAIAQSGFSDTPQQGTFLLNIVNILNSIKESVDSGKIAKSFCTIFAQTLLSSEEFHAFIYDKQRALATRLKDHHHDIKYSLPETVSIIQKRLSAAGQTNENQLFPFNEEIIEFLFTEINKLTQTEALVDFRTMEQLFRISIERSLEKDLSQVSIDVVKEVFREESLKIQKASSRTQVEQLVLSKETIDNVDKIIAAGPNESNIAFLRGIAKAMQSWEVGTNSEYKDVSLKNVSNQPGTGDFIITSAQIQVIANATLHTKNFLWYTVAKPDNSFTKEDFEKLQVWFESNRKQQLGKQQILLTVFVDESNLPEFTEDDVKEKFLKTIDHIFYRGIITKKKFIQMWLATEKEKPQFENIWNEKHSALIRNHLGSTLHDIGDELKQNSLMALKYIVLKSITGEIFSKPEIITYTKIISGLNITSGNVKLLNYLGFTNDESTNVKLLIPHNLESLKILIENPETDERGNNIQLTDDKVKEVFGKTYTLDAAKSLGTISDENALVNVDEIKTRVQDEYITRIDEAISNASTSTEILDLLKLCKNAFDKIDGIENYFTKTIGLVTIIEFADKLLQTSGGEPGGGEPGGGEPGGGEPGGGEPGGGEPIEFTIETTEQICLKVINESPEKKFSINDLIAKIKLEPGWNQNTSWQTHIYNLVRQGKLLLTGVN